jgi:hypothetical protein
MKKPYIGVSIEQDSMAAYLQVENDDEDNYKGIFRNYSKWL